MKVAGKIRESAVRIVDDGVVMVAHREPTDDLDVESLSGFAEAIKKSLIGLVVRTQQELSLRAAARDEISPAGEDRPGMAHGCVRKRRACRGAKFENLRRIAGRSWRPPVRPVAGATFHARHDDDGRTGPGLDEPDRG